MNPKFRKTYPGKGWVYGTDDQPPNPKKKDIIWISQVHRWDSEVRSPNTRFIIMIKKGKFSIGITAGIESTIAPKDWIDGLNRMDLNIVPAEFVKEMIEQTKYEEKQG